MIKLETPDAGRAHELRFVLRQMGKRCLVLGSAVITQGLDWYQLETCKYIGSAWCGTVTSEDVELWSANEPQ